MKNLVFALFLLFPNMCFAQWGWGWTNHHSSTLEEGIYTGLSRYYMGLGQYARNVAEARVINEQAHRSHTDNWANDVATRNAIKDDWKQRHHNTYVENAKKRIEGLKIAAELKAEEDALRGPRPAPKLVHNGHTYTNYAEFKESDDYSIMKHEQAIQDYQDQIIKQIEEERYREALLRTVLREKGYIK